MTLTAGPLRSVIAPAAGASPVDKLGGTVAKFDANVDAIATLRHVECHDRAPFTAERSRLEAALPKGCRRVVLDERGTRLAPRAEGAERPGLILGCDVGRRQRPPRPRGVIQAQGLSCPAS